MAHNVGCSGYFGYISTRPFACSQLDIYPVFMFAWRCRNLQCLVWMKEVPLCVERCEEVMPFSIDGTQKAEANGYPEEDR
jgi:hypothetical protein